MVSATGGQQASVGAQGQAMHSAIMRISRRRPGMRPGSERLARSLRSETGLPGGCEPDRPQASGDGFGQDDVATGPGQSRQHQADTDGGTGCSPEKVSSVRHANVVLFRLLRSCFARSIDWVLCAKELRHALPSLMRRKPLDLNPSRTPLNTNLTTLNPDAGWCQGKSSSLIRFFGYF